MSSAESEAAFNERYNLRSRIVENKNKSNAKNHRDKSAPPLSGNFNEKIDSIFSEVTHEISYRESSAGSKQVPPHVRHRSPIRRVDDPLPTPPPPPPQPIPPHTASFGGGASLKSEVIVYEDYEDKQKQSNVPLTKSVKAQVHSLEARGRDFGRGKNAETKAKMARSKSENPPLVSRRGMSLAQNLMDVPPPMPEKTKIHLKGSTTETLESRASSNLTNISSASKRQQQLQRQAKANKASPSSSKPSRARSSSSVMSNHMSPVSSVSHRSSSNQYESVGQGGPNSVLSSAPSQRTNDSRSRSRLASREESRLEYRRSRSLGALEANKLAEAEAEESVLTGRSGASSRRTVTSNQQQTPRSQRPTSSGVSSSSRDRRSGNAPQGPSARMISTSASNASSSKSKRGRSLERGLLSSGPGGGSTSMLANPNPPSPRRAQEEIDQFLPR